MDVKQLAHALEMVEWTETRLKPDRQVE